MDNKPRKRVSIMTTKEAFVKSFLFYALAALGVSLTLKAAIGVSAFNAMNLSIAYVNDIKVGSIMTFFNTMFLIGYILLTQFKYPLKYFIQFTAVFTFGSLINFFLYGLLSNIEITYYPIRVLLVIVGTITAGMAVGMVLNYDKITFPMEAFCLALSQVTPLKFIHLRYGVDVISISVSLILTMIFSLPFTAREGTFINMLLLSWAINYAKEKFPVY
jgi:uncharacterized membrane protein YczE